MIDLKARAEHRPREQRSGTMMVASAPLEVRATVGAETIGVQGFACVTNVSYTMRDWLGEYEEVVRSGAFTKTLAEQDDVRLLLNHDGLPLARTKSGTLNLREILDPKKDPQKRSQTGLWIEADLDPESGLVRDITSAMARGDLDEMSFAFQVTKQEWAPDFTQRDIQEVRLFDVSVVTYPANPATSASLRSDEPASVPGSGYDPTQARLLSEVYSERKRTLLTKSRSLSRSL